MLKIESIPNAERTFDALRSIGYDLNSSIADIIDNSITAKAKYIEVSINRFKKKFLLTIKDDGKGMKENQLEEAMRIGAQNIYNEGDLGKFGFGLKTASLSHCNILTVISKTKSSNIVGYQWNMGHIKGSNKWELLKLNGNEIKDVLNSSKSKLVNPGTIVIWNDVFSFDRDFDSYDSEKLANNFLFRKKEELKLYIATVFHKYLDGSAGKKVVIKIDEKLQPWDPYCKKEKNTIKVDLKKGLSSFKIPGYKKSIKIIPYVLPNQEGFSSETAWKNAKGVLSWNDAQGYYIYRENRLIRFGGWQGTKAKDEHDKLARIDIEISSEMDDLFSLTVNKSKIQFPELLFHQLKSKINPIVVKKAQGQYRKLNLKPAIINKLRKQYGKLTTISEEFIKDKKIHTSKGNSNSVIVKNPKGQFFSNKISDFIKYGTREDFEIVTDVLENGHLWKIIGYPDDKFKLILNLEHPFYQKIYESDNDKKVTCTVDAFIIALAFAEIYNRNEENAHLFETFKTVTSTLLKKIIKEAVI